MFVCCQDSSRNINTPIKNAVGRGAYKQPDIPTQLSHQGEECVGVVVGGHLGNNSAEMTYNVYVFLIEEP